MRVSLFDFDLPEGRIATHPASPRESAKLLHITPDALNDKQVSDLPSLLSAGDVLVLNNTRVIPARLYGTRGEVKIELLLHKPLPNGDWTVFARPAKRLKPGDIITIADNLAAEVIDKTPSGEVIIRWQTDDLVAALEKHGHMPLPPYIERADEAADKQDYQTCYAEHNGSVAAPTAGLHYTPELLDTIRARGVTIVYVTLHVGGGTFLPVKAEDTEDHHMHSEWGEVTAEVADAVNHAAGRVIAVGTTSLRLLESAADEQGVLHPFCDETDIFITPGYRFKCVDCLMTNFHLPKSTLFMLVSAFAGLERVQSAYQHAIDNHYRFYSYGDACFLERQDG